MKKLLFIVLFLTGCVFKNSSIQSFSSLPSVENFQETEYKIINSRELVPLNLHKGIWKDVAETCLELDNYPDVKNVHWFLADSIIVTEKINESTDSTISYYAYGMTNFVYNKNNDVERINIIIEEDYWFVSDVISHESAHGITGNWTHGPWIWNCTMNTPIIMPLRVRDPDF